MQYLRRGKSRSWSTLLVAAAVLFAILGLTIAEPNTGAVRGEFCCGGGGGGGGGCGESGYCFYLSISVTPNNGSVYISGPDVAASFQNGTIAELNAGIKYNITSERDPAFKLSKWVAVGGTVGSKTDQVTTLKSNSSTETTDGSLNAVLATGDYFNVTIKASPTTGGTVRITGLGASATPYKDGQVAHLWARATYGVQALPATNYAFSEWKETGVDLSSAEQGATTFNSTDTTGTSTGTLTLDLVSWTYVDLEIFAYDQAGTVEVFDPMTNETTAYANGTSVELPIGTTLGITANMSTGWAFDQWYAPSEQVAKLNNASTTVTLTDSSPASLALLGTTAAFASNADPWTGYLASYSNVLAADGTFTVPTISENQSYPSYVYYADELTEWVGIGGVGPYSTLFNAGVGQFLLLSNGTVVPFVFVAVFANDSTPTQNDGTFAYDTCYYPVWFYDLVSVYPAQITAPVTCSQATPESFSTAPPAAGWTVTDDISWQNYSLPTIAYDLSWSEGGVEKGYVYSGETAVNDRPSANSAEWIVETGDNPYYGACSYNDQSEPYCIAPPNITTPATFSSESAEQGSSSTWVDSLGGAPVAAEWGNWGEAGSTVYPWTVFFPSALGATGSFEAPVYELVPCATCTNSNTRYTYASSMTGFTVTKTDTDGVSGWGTAGNDGTPSWSGSGLVENIAPVATAVYVAAAESWTLGGYSGDSELSVDVTGFYGVIFNWTIDWDAVVGADFCTDGDFFSSDLADGYMNLVGNTYVYSAAGATTTSVTNTFNQTWSSCGLSLGGGGGDGYVLASEDVYVVAGESVGFQTYLEAYAEASASGLVQASDVEDIYWGQLNSISLSPLTLPS
jgi:hypothetical protein